MNNEMSDLEYFMYFNKLWVSESLPPGYTNFTVECWGGSSKPTGIMADLKIMETAVNNLRYDRAMKVVRG